MVNNLDSLWVTRSSSQHSTLLLRHKITGRSWAWLHSNKTSSGLERVCADQSVQIETRGRLVGQQGRGWWAWEPGFCGTSTSFSWLFLSMSGRCCFPFYLDGCILSSLTACFISALGRPEPSFSTLVSLLQLPFLFLSSSHYLVVMHLLSMSSARM